MASPALAGPTNSTIGGKKLTDDMVHNAGVGAPGIFYSWWNRGEGNLDWAIEGEFLYRDWPAVIPSVRSFSTFSFDLLRLGFAVDGILRWNLMTKERAKVTNDLAILFKPGILIGSNNIGSSNSFTFGLKGEVGVPVSIDVHDRVSVVTGGFIPLTWYINPDTANAFLLPVLARMGVEIRANEKLAPWFYFDLGWNTTFSNAVFGGNTNTTFAWRIGAGLAFWNVRGKNPSPSSGGGDGGDDYVEPTYDDSEVFE
ncbi:MAG: hypothetical protein AAF500_03990 [Myxococcota bacterium]